MGIFGTPEYPRLDVVRLTRRTAPERGFITHNERVSRYVLIGDGALLLVGLLGVNYFIERTDANGLYLRRADVPPRRPEDLQRTRSNRASG